jgi:hypothetical protein
VQGNRQRLKVLSEMEFVWDVVDFAFAHQIVPALQWHKERHGTFNVEQAFELPGTADVPRLILGFKLGQTVYSIRSKQNYVKNYKQRRHLNVEQTCELPEAADAPCLLWGFKLGQTVCGIRSHKCFVKGNQPAAPLSPHSTTAAATLLWPARCCVVVLTDSGPVCWLHPSLCVELLCYPTALNYY